MSSDHPASEVESLPPVVAVDLPRFETIFLFRSAEVVDYHEVSGRPPAISYKTDVVKASV